MDPEHSRILTELTVQRIVGHGSDAETFVSLLSIHQFMLATTELRIFIPLFAQSNAYLCKRHAVVEIRLMSRSLKHFDRRRQRMLPSPFRCYKRSRLRKPTGKASVSTLDHRQDFERFKKSVLAIMPIRANGKNFGAKPSCDFRVAFHERGLNHDTAANQSRFC